MTAFALSLVLLAALTHATWNYFAKSAVASRHFVWLYSLGSVILYAPIVAWLLIAERPQSTAQHSPVSHVAPARELATLVGAYLGSRLLKEQSGPRRIVGAACIVAGVVSLAFAPAQ